VKERTLNCHKCFAVIIVGGPDRDVPAALRRVDWRYEAGKATCRDCDH
jgi:hypothetical protein